MIERNNIWICVAVVVLIEALGPVYGSDCDNSNDLYCENTDLHTHTGFLIAIIIASVIGFLSVVSFIVFCCCIACKIASFSNGRGKGVVRPQPTTIAVSQQQQQQQQQRQQQHLQQYYGQPVFGRQTFPPPPSYSQITTNPPPHMPSASAPPMYREDVFPPCGIPYKQ